MNDKLVVFLYTLRRQYPGVSLEAAYDEAKFLTKDDDFESDDDDVLRQAKSLARRLRK